MEPSRHDQTSRAWIRRGAGVALLAVLIAGIVRVLPGSAPVTAGGDGDVPGILRYEDHGRLYTYHVLTGTESLFDTTADPRCLHNLARIESRMTRHLRRELVRKLGVTDLDQLRGEYAQDIERLRGIGYF